MKNWIKTLFGSKEQPQIVDWRTDNSIFSFLSEYIDTDGTLLNSADDLPDEKLRDENKLRFAPGLIDAMFGANAQEDSAERINELTNCLTKVARNGDKAAETDFYNLVISNEGVVSIIDEFLSNIVSKSLPIQPYLFKFSKDLALKTKHRNSVKFGIAILGLCQNKSIITELKILGLHDEFTVFTIVALSNLSDNLVQDLWELSKKVNGWGKIQLIDRLARMELTVEQRDWLLRKGYKNSIMYEYLAYTCALNGKLHEKLEGISIDQELFKSSGEIIEALISGGPAESISEYIYASEVVENFIRHAKTQTTDIADFLTLHRIRDFLFELQNDIGEHQKNGWTDDIISNSIIDINAILESRDWIEPTYHALNSSDRVTYWNGKSAANKLGIDLWETFWSKLMQQPMDSTAWYDVTHYDNPNKAEQIIEFALNAMPFHELASGPKDSMGMGPHYNKYQSLEYVITFLESYPRKGEQIVLTGLNSPVTRNRNMAIKTLGKWKKENWSDAIRQQVEKLSVIEPNKDTKLSIAKLLNGDNESAIG